MPAPLKINRKRLLGSNLIIFLLPSLILFFIMGDLAGASVIFYLLLILFLLPVILISEYLFRRFLNRFDYVDSSIYSKTLETDQAKGNDQYLFSWKIPFLEALFLQLRKSWKLSLVLLISLTIAFSFLATLFAHQAIPSLNLFSLFGILTIETSIIFLATLLLCILYLFISKMLGMYNVSYKLTTQGIFFTDTYQNEPARYGLRFIGYAGWFRPYASINEIKFDDKNKSIEILFKSNETFKKALIICTKENYRDVASYIKSKQRKT